MKKIIHIIPVFLILLLISNAYGFAEYAENNSVVPSELTELTNVTDSDQDIVLLQHLIEIDAVTFQTEKKLAVKETLIFKNIGSRNFSGVLRTWVPDGIEDIRVGIVAMTADAVVTPVQAMQNGNIISWNAGMGMDEFPPLFSVEYLLTTEPKGTVSSVRTYSKKFAYPTLINYRYMDRPDLPAVVVKVTKSEDSSLTFLDENRNKISSVDVTEDGNSIISRFSSPRFKELDIEISRSAVTSNITSYVILGILILIVLSYPFLRKKSEKLQKFEEKIKNSLKREPGETDVQDEAIDEEPVEEEEDEEAGEKVDVSGKTENELEDEKKEILTKLDELEKEYSAGNLLDEEYEEQKSIYKAKIRRIEKSLERSE